MSSDFPPARFSQTLEAMLQVRNNPSLRLKLFCGLGAVMVAGGISTTYRNVERDTSRIYSCRHRS